MDRTDRDERRRTTLDDDAQRHDPDLGPPQRRDPDLDGDGHPDAARDGVGVTGDRRSVDVDARWKVTQSRFLEAPQEAVSAADELVADVIEDVRRRLDEERAQVAALWRRDGVDTEDLRTAMLRYREVLDRLTTA